MTAVMMPAAPSGSLPTPPVRSGRARVAWTVAGLVVAAALTAVTVLSTVADTADQKIPLRQRDFTSALSSVSLRVASGTVTVERGSGPRTVVRTWGTRGLSFPTDQERVAGRSLVIRSTCGTFNFSNNCSRNYVVHVGPAVSVTVDSGEGDIVVGAMSGPLTLYTGEGDVTVRNGDGLLRATTGEGDISVTGAHSDQVEAKSGEGDVAVGLATVPARVMVTSSEGDVTVELPRGPASYRVHVNSGEGQVSNTVKDNPASRRQVSATSGEGDVSVRYRSR
jgi:hypothetical protein